MMGALRGTDPSPCARGVALASSRSQFWSVLHAGITGLSALQGNLGLAGLTGILGAFLAFQVCCSSLLLSIHMHGTGQYFCACMQCQYTHSATHVTCWRCCTGSSVEESAGLMQASRVKFVFDSDSLEVVLGNEAAETENAFVGGENKWKFSTFTNWEFWWPNFPVLVYFKVQAVGPHCTCTTLAVSECCNSLTDGAVEATGKAAVQGEVFGLSRSRGKFS